MSVGGKHDLGFAGFGNGEADCATLDLFAGEHWALMGLGVGAEPEFMLRRVVGHALEVGFHNVQVDY